MLFYLAWFGFLTGIGLYASGPQQKLLLPVISALAFWFMGWRYYVGCDFTGYLNRFEQVPSWANPSDFLLEPEGIFQFLTAYLKLNHFDYVWLNIISSAIIIVSYGWYLRSSRQPIAELALLFPIIILQLSMSGIRQGIAVAMLTAACAEFIKGRRMSTAALIILAAQFHTSAAAFLPLALLAGRTLSWTRLVIAVAALAPVAAYLIGSQADDYADQYVRQVYGASESNGALPRYLLVLAPFLYFWVRRDDFRKRMASRYQLFQVFFLIIVAMAPLFLVSSLIVHRLTFYVMPISVMVIANAYRLRDRGSERDLVRYGPFLAYGTYLLGWLMLSKHADACYIPYQNYSFV